MSKSKRDPLMDPVSGDVIRKGNLMREVLYREFGSGKTWMSNRVQVRTGATSQYRSKLDEWALSWALTSRESRPSLKQFRRWAKGAEVVKHGD